MKKLIVTTALLCLISTALWAAPAVYRIHANVKASLTFPDANQIDTVEYVSGDSEIRPVPLRQDGDRITFELTPEMLSRGSTIVILNRPPGRDLSDRAAPSFDRIIVDGNPIQDHEHLTLPYAPREIQVVLTDPSGITARGLDMTVNGHTAPRANIDIQRQDLGRHWRLTYSPSEPDQFRTLSLTATDRSLLANTARLALSIEQGVTIVEGNFSGQKAVQLSEESGFLARRVNLPAGKYQLEIAGMGSSSGANSLWVEVDGEQQPDPVHLPVEDLGIASRVVDVDPDALPRFTVPEDGEHALVLTLREGPAPTVDRVRILQEGEEIAAFEAEQMLPTFPKP